ncbi:MAG: DUF2330 domain-containing protein [bacterium]
MNRLALLALLAPLAPAAAHACGGVFAPVEAEATIAFDTQTALIHRRPDRVDVHLRMTIAPGAETFSWVLPAPQGATLDLGDDALFDTLDGLTRPVITIEHVGGGGLCSGDAAAGAGGPPDLDIEELGRIGEYDYAIIATGDATAAVTWLTDNGFAVPDGAAAAMQPYADAGMDFIGVRLARPDPDAVRPTPLVVSTPDTTDELPLYPLGMSRLSAGDTLPVVLYVLGPARAAVTNADASTVVELADLIRADRSLDYEDATDLLQRDTTEPLWITDAVVVDPDHPDLAALGGRYLTRLSARLPPDRIRDVALAAHPGTEPIDPHQHPTIGEDDGCAALAGGHAPAWALVLLFGALRLRRRAPRAPSR